MKDIWLTELDGKSGGMGHPQVLLPGRPHNTASPQRAALTC